jgi:hypothetical protein
MACRIWGNPGVLFIAFGSFRLLASQMISRLRWTYAKWPRLFGMQILVGRAKKSDNFDRFYGNFQYCPSHYSIDFNNTTFKIHLNQNTLDDYTVLSAWERQQLSLMPRAQSNTINLFKHIWLIIKQKTMVRISLGKSSVTVTHYKDIKTNTNVNNNETTLSHCCTQNIVSIHCSVSNLPDY